MVSVGLVVESKRSRNEGANADALAFKSHFLVVHPHRIHMAGEGLRFRETYVAIPSAQSLIHIFSLRSAHMQNTGDDNDEIVRVRVAR